MIWLQLTLSAISALAGGFVGGCLVAYRMGRWRESVEQRLAIHQARLERGDIPLDKVPVIEARLDTVILELRDLRRELREDFSRLVTREECDRRHGDGG